MYWHFDKILSPFQCGFRKNYSVQRCLIAMAEKLRQSSDKGDTRAALLIDLSELFDCLPHEFLIAKLHAYGTDLPFLKILPAFLSR